MTNPTLTGLAPSVMLAENTANAGPQLLFGDVMLTDPEGLAGGVLRVTGLLAEDRVSVLGEAPASGAITLSGDTLTYFVESGHASITVGTVSGGVGADLRINLAAGATIVAVEALIERLAYANASDTPTAARNLTLHLTDAAGIGIGASAYAEQPNRFNSVDVGYDSTPAFANIDGDADLELVIGNSDGRLDVYDPGNGLLHRSASPFASVNAGNSSAPAFADIDGDGDGDLVVGERYGELKFFSNFGILGFASLTGDANPLGGVDAGRNSTPAFVDITGNGLLDIVVGAADGGLNFFFKYGVGKYAQLTGDANPFNHVDVQYSAAPAFADIDNDGDLDLVVGSAHGTLRSFANKGGGVYAELAGDANPFDGVDVGYDSAPAFGDVDGDGDIDVVVGADDGKLHVFAQSQAGLQVAVTVAAENEAPVLTDLAPAVTFAEDVVNAAPQLLFGNVTLTEPEGDDFGVLQVTGLLAEDTVSVRGAGAIGLSGADVTYRGAVIGTLTGGVGADLRIVLTAGADAAAVEALIESITYANASDTPTADRTLRLHLTDATGAGITPGVYDAPLTGADNPLDGVDMGALSSPVFADLDGDGDLDLVIGGTDGSRRVFANDGDGGFAELTGPGNPMRLVDTVDFVAAAFADINGDGHFDVVLGAADGTLHASAGDGAGGFYTLKGDANPFGSLDVGKFSTPAFADVDSDGDLDLVVGEFYGKLRTFANDGVGGFAELTGAANPFGGVSTGGYSAPAFADLDADGDLDAVIGGEDGTLQVFTNDGIGGFAALTGAANPLNGVSADGRSVAAFADIDGDGDLDAVIGGADGTLGVIAQTRDGLAVAVTVAAVNDAPVLTGLAPTVTFAENTVNAGPQLLFGDVALTDPEGLAGGVLRVTGLRAEDTVSVQAGGLIGLSGSEVTYDGAPIAALSGGAGAELRIDLGANADAAAVEALIERIAYANASDAPAAHRTLRLHLVDASGDGIGADAINTRLTGAANPFSGVDLGNGSAPAFVDIDGDGDLDAVIGEAYGTLRVFENDGAGAYAALTDANNPFDGVDVGRYSRPAFVDLDGDGHLDAVVGAYDGKLRAFANDGAGGFAALIDAANPFNELGGIPRAAPAFVDIDGDGDLDLVIGQKYEALHLYANDGAGGYARLSGAANPFNGIDGDYDTAPAFTDVDGDGDLDFVVGTNSGKMRVFANDGAGAYAELVGQDNPFNGVDVGAFSAPAFVDLDSDGDLDAVVGELNGTLRAYARAPGGLVVAVTVTPDNEAPVLADAALALPDQAEDLAPPADPSAGALASTLTGGATDPDGDAIGIAVTGVAAGAVLHVSLDHGATWAEAAAPTPSAALLLAPDARIAMTTAQEYSGTLSDALTIRAWDGSAGASGDVVDATLTGGGTAFSGASDTVALTVKAVNDETVLTGLAPAVTFAEETVNAGPQLLFGDVTLTDPEGFAGGVLLVTGVLAEDTVSVLDGGTGAGAIGLSGGDVTYGGAIIAALSGGAGTALRIDLGAGADAAAVEALIESIAYANASDAPAANRTLRLHLTDASGEDIAPDGYAPLTGADNPFDGLDAGFYSMPAFVDLDDDGDLDAVLGGYNSTLRSFVNDGAGGFAELIGAGNPLDGIDLGASRSFAFADVDGDGDQDIVIGSQLDHVRVLANDGDGAYAEVTGADNPLGHARVSRWAAPGFADIDGDGDIDAVIGEADGTLRLFDNQGGGVYAQLTGAANPFHGVDVGTISAPAFADIDGDGDLDAVVGRYKGALRAFANDGSGGFDELTGAANPFSGFHVGDWSVPAIADITGDGKLEVVVGAKSGQLRVFAQPPGVAVAVTVTPWNERPAAQNDTLTTDEGTVISGSVLDDNGAGADVDPDGDALTIAAVDGAAASVGAQITLTSGALLTVNADGSYEYDPNGAFEEYGGTGLSFFIDAFTYTVSDGSVDLADDATVIVNVNGVNDAPVFTSPAAFSTHAGETAIGAVAARDVEGDRLTYAIAAGADADLFAIDEVTGALSFRAPPTGGAYAVTVAAFDGAATAEQAVTVTAPKPIGEVVQLTVGTSWQTLSFANTYENAVVFALAPSLREADAAATRFQNITGTGAEIRLQEPGNSHTGVDNPGDHVDETVTLLVLEQGAHRLEDGTIIQVAELETGVGGFEDVAFDKAFDDAPSIFSQVQTYNDADFVITRQRNPGADGFELTMQEEQADTLGHGAETVGWFAIAHGGGALSTMDWQAGSSSQKVNGNLTKVHFNDRFDEAPLVMASLATYGGTDTASTRIGSVQRDGFKTVALEDRSFDAELQHGFEAVDWMAFSNEGLIHAAAPEQVIAQAGFAVASGAAVTVSFGSQFEHPVVIASLTSMASGAAAIARVSNVTEAGFDLVLQTPGGAAHAPETVSWMVVEAGSWQLADGTMLQAGLTDPGAGFASIAFDAGFDDGPAVLTQTQTMGDAAFVKTRMQAVDGAGFEVALEGAEAAEAGAETVGWIAVDMGRASDADGFVFEAGEVSTNQKWGVDTFSGAFDAPGVVAGMSSFNGRDAAAARIDAITATGFQIKVEEDQTRDAETFHATETFHWIAFDQGEVWGDALV